MLRVGVVGAGGLVGRRLVQSIEKRENLDVDLLVTGHNVSPGKSISFRGEKLIIRKTRSDDLRKCQIVVLCTPTKASVELTKELGATSDQDLSGGPLVIDTSSAFRMNDWVPLVIPEVNGDDIKNHKGIVAGPNCSTIQMVMAINPIHKEYGLERVVVSTYQSCSGAGLKAMQELEETSLNWLIAPPDSEKEEWKEEPKKNSRQTKESEFPHPIAFNLIPEIDEFLASGYTKEEMKMVNETRKIMHLPNLAVSSTCVRVPTFIGHALSLMTETKKEPDILRVKEILAISPGIKVLDEPEKSLYPMPITVQDREEVFIGRIRKDISTSKGLLMWVCADNLLRGAATNACNILERVIKERLF